MLRKFRRTPNRPVLGLAALLVALSVAVPLLDRGMFSEPISIAGPHEHLPGVAGHDHAICVVYHANPGVPTVPTAPRRGTSAEVRIALQVPSTRDDASPLLRPRTRAPPSI